MPFFSVIIPNYNHAAFLEERIDSILAQTDQDFELIFIDDHSTDNSLDIVKKYQANFKAILTQPFNNGNLLTQWKTALDHATGRWIWIAESDDIAQPGFLAAMRALIETGSGPVLCYCDARIFDMESGTRTALFSARKNELFSTHRWSFPYQADGKDEIQQYLQYDCTINNMSSAVISYDALQDVLQKAPSFRYYPDWYLFIQLCLLGGLTYTPEVLNTYRKHPDSLLHKKTGIVQSRYEYFQICRLLWRQQTPANQAVFLRFFTYNYLSTGLINDGPFATLRVLLAYFRKDFPLARRILAILVSIRLFPEKYRRYGLRPGFFQAFN